MYQYSTKRIDNLCGFLLYRSSFITFFSVSTRKIIMSEYQVLQMENKFFSIRITYIKYEYGVLAKYYSADSIIELDFRVVIRLLPNISYQAKC